MSKTTCHLFSVGMSSELAIMIDLKAFSMVSSEWAEFLRNALHVDLESGLTPARKSEMHAKIT